MSLATRLDYLQGTCRFEYESAVDQFLDYICDLFPGGDSLYYKPRSIVVGRRVYSKSFGSIKGKLYGGVSHSRTDGTYLLYIQMPGSYCSRFDISEVHRLSRFLSHNGFKFTRSDIAVDDFNRRISFDEVARIGELGFYRFVQCYEKIESKVSRSSPCVPTLYFGSGYKKFRFYNAEVVHGFQADRWELQLGYRHAQSFMSDFLSNPDSLNAYFSGAIDFGEEIGGYWSSFRRFDWWQSLIDDLGLDPIKIKLSSFNPCFDRSLKWLYSQVAPTLAVASQAYTRDDFICLIDDLVDSGRSRFRDYHHKLIFEVKQEMYFKCFLKNVLFCLLILVVIPLVLIMRLIIQILITLMFLKKPILNIGGVMFP